MKNSPSEYRLTDLQFRTLVGAAAVVPPDRPSVFRVEPGPPLLESERRELAGKGYVDPEGRPVEGLGRILRILTTSDAHAAVAYEGSGLLASAAAYHAGEESVLMLETGQGLRLIPHLPKFFIHDLLGHHLGTSPLRGLELDATLPSADALVLAALIDLRRRELLGALLDRRAEEPGLLPWSAVADWLAAGDSGGQWITPRLQHFLGLEAPPPAAEIRAALERAVAQGRATAPQSNTLRVGEAIDSAARQLLLISNRLVLRASCLGPDAGSMVSLTMQTLQAGVAGILLFDPTGPGSVRMAGVSPQWVLAVAAQLFARPQSLRTLAPASFTAQAAPPAPETKPAPPTDSSYPAAATACPACGGTNAAESRFCSHCGQPLTDHCRKCGAARAPGDRFCAACGTLLEKEAA